jgi:hypothetical protein
MRLLKKEENISKKVLHILAEPGVPMRQTSRIVTTIEGIEVIEVTVRDPKGDPIQTYYRVRGEKYESLKQAMEAVG